MDPLNSPVIDITGQRFGRLVALHRVPRLPGAGGACWKFVCDCGAEIEAPGRRARSGKRMSCGCLQRSTHGLTLADRFWRKAQKTDGCWLWTGSIGRNGYGRFWHGKTFVSAHRLALQLSGVEVPSDLFVCHHCDNPPCVNPAHLFLGDHDDNMRDMAAKGRARNGGSPPDTLVGRPEWRSIRPEGR